MLIRLIRLFKRLVVFGFGAGIIYLSVWYIFPFFDNRVPLAIALLATYVFVAYFFIPFTFRIFRLFYQPNHIPLYCVTPDGFASDPINIGVIATQKQLEKAMKKAGWHKAHKRTPVTAFRMVKAIVTRKPYVNAPFSSLYLFGRKQDLGFQKPSSGSPSHRHHVRFWACHLDGPEQFHKDVHFWQRFHRPSHDNKSRQLWIGAASRDIGIMPIKHNMQITHMIDPDTNAERDLIVHDLRMSHSVKKTITEKVHPGFSLPNRVIGGILHTDGKLRICILKD